MIRRSSRRSLVVAAALAAVLGAAGCGTAEPAGALPAAGPPTPVLGSQPTAGLTEAGEPPQVGITAAPQGVPAVGWAAMTTLVDIRAAGDRPLPEPLEAPSCSLAGCSWSFGTETLVWSASSGARALRTEVFSRWKSSGGNLGWPVTSEYSFGGDYRTDFQKGTLMYVPRLGRTMAYLPEVEKAAVVIGDSQAGRDTWVGKGLFSLGYHPVILGAGGTGYTQGNGRVGNYPSALEGEEWLMPWGKPGLVVLQGGGNDAHGPSNQAIRQNALQLIREIRRTYPETRIVVVGVIGDGGGRRGEVDDLMARVSAEEDLEFLSPKDWWKRYSLGSKLDDGLHFGRAGHDAAAPVFARELRKILDRPQD
ncbi:SGNH/GDSL hydrolase family protein [Arthrobacter caoxuetaonis]|uniref:SGNH/GDSL hydrolase family protein n=1 Tax=Arthrobacter caoxuetaonis TaxID=2886935 RepID=A0A9X1MCA7_9MICC|nr:SGNH/GDSL hydrolase family protein [Arthrobacter caoxuetaonis]MCC3296705.1 SGNH/GDSL hydrolase family protein [Arthrobacter caoxuetaonis]USQ56473.1 SGNH/GDSL hydrolase family protein [Arthrobacter caoxuetaonis]